MVRIVAVTALVACFPAAVMAEQASACPEEVLAWVSRAQGEVGFSITPVSCPEGILRLRFDIPDVQVLDVELSDPPRQAFVSVGRFGISPIVDVHEYGALPEGQRRAFEAFVQWLRVNHEGVQGSPGQTRRGFAGQGFLVFLGLLALVALVWRGESKRPRDAASGQPVCRVGPDFGFKREVILYSGVGLIALAVVMVSIPQATEYHIDTARDVLAARSIARGEAITGELAPSSVTLRHGTAWLRVLALFVDHDGGLRTLQWALALLTVLSTLALFSLVRGRASRFLALVPTMIFLAWLPRAGLFSPLWQPTLVLHLTCLWGFLAYRSYASSKASLPVLIGSASFFSIATQVHLEMFLLFPGMIVLCWRFRCRTLASIMTSVIVMGGWALLSPAAFHENGELLLRLASARCGPLDVGAAVGVGTSLVVALLLLVVVALAFVWLVVRRMSGPWILFLSVCLGSYAVGYGIVLLFHAHESRYLTPTVPLLCLATAEILEATLVRTALPARRSIAIVACSLSALSMLFWAFSTKEHRLDRPLSFREISDILAAVRSFGVSLDEAYCGISSDQAIYTDLISGLWVSAACQRERAELGCRENPARRLLVEAIPRGEHGLASFRDGVHVEGDERQFVVAPYRPYVRVGTFRVCWPGGAGERECREQRFAFRNRSFGRSCFDPGWPHASLDLLEGVRAEGLTLELEVHVPARASAHVVSFGARRSRGEARDRCRGRVVEVHGVDHRRRPRPWQVELLGSIREQHGQLLVAWPFADRACFEGFLVFPLPMTEIESERSSLLDTDSH